MRGIALNGTKNCGKHGMMAVENGGERMIRRIVV